MKVLEPILNHWSASCLARVRIYGFLQGSLFTARSFTNRGLVEGSAPKDTNALGFILHSWGTSCFREKHAHYKNLESYWFDSTALRSGIKGAPDGALMRRNAAKRKALGRSNDTVGETQESPESATVSREIHEALNLGEGQKVDSSHLHATTNRWFATALSALWEKRDACSSFQRVRFFPEATVILHGVVEIGGSVYLPVELQFPATETRRSVEKRMRAFLIPPAGEVGALGYLHGYVELDGDFNRIDPLGTIFVRKGVSIRIAGSVKDIIREHKETMRKAKDNRQRVMSFSRM